MKTKELLELLDRATKGPWAYTCRTGCFGVFPDKKEPNCMAGGSEWMIVYQSGRGEESGPNCYKYLTEEQRANAALIALAPDLAAEVLRLREREKVLVDALATARNALDLSTTHRNEDRVVIVNAQRKIIAALMTNAETED